MFRLAFNKRFFDPEWNQITPFGALRGELFEGGKPMEIDIKVGSVRSDVEKIELLRAALERSITAIDDWLHLYAPDICDEARVAEAQERVGKYGTIGYIAGVQEQNQAAIRKGEA